MAETKTKGVIVANSKAIEPAAEDDWRARSDVHTLTSAHEIRQDKKRHGKAKAMAKRMMKERKAAHIQEMGRMQNVADGDAEDLIDGGADEATENKRGAAPRRK